VPELTERDPAELSATLTAWLTATLGPAAEPVIIEVNAPASSGFSNETILTTASWVEEGVRSEHGLVFRVHPTQHTLFLDADFSLQYNVLRSLQGIDELPVPTVRFYEDDPSYLGVPFFVMDRVEGRVPADNLPYTMEGWLLDSTPEQQAELWWSGLDALAAVHSLDWEDRGLGFLAEGLRGAPGLDHLLAYYREFLDTAAKGRPQPTTEAIWDWLVANRPAETGPLVLSWGDSRIGNIIWDEAYHPASVLDWEMATLGQPELDLGWWLYFDRQFSEGLGMPRPTGFPPHDETIARYEALLGRPMENLFWYQVFAGFRFAVIMCRLSDLLMGSGILPEDSDMGTNNLATQFTATLLGLPSPAEVAESKD
jgi:aminoglycoside phosphotransferase (APT) family kinase protein